MLSQHEASFTVGLRVHLMHLSEHKVHLLSHHVSNQLRAYSSLVVVKNLLLDLLAAHHGYVPVQQLVGGLLDSFNLPEAVLLSLFPLS